MSIFNLFGLPVELIDSVILFLSTEDVCSLRLTCRKLHLSATQILFRTIRLQPHFASGGGCKLVIAMSGVAGTAAGTAASDIDITAYVRHLVIDYYQESRTMIRDKKGDPPTPNYEHLPALFDPEDQAIEQDELLPEAVVAKLVPVPAPVVVPQPKPQVVKKHFVPFVRRLQNLQSLRWVYEPRANSNKYIPNAMGAFSTLPNLKEVSIQIRNHTGEHSLPNLFAFKNLHSLHVTYDQWNSIEHPFAKYIKSDIIPAVAASPMLRSLRIARSRGNFYSFTEEQISELGEAVAGLWTRETSTPMYIRDLRFAAIPLRINTEFVRAFRDLRHLTVSLHGSHLAICEEIAWEQIWNALYDMGTNHCVWLETLTTEGYQPVPGLTALFRYLKSHPGLRTLALTRLPYERFDHNPNEPAFDEYGHPSAATENLITSEFANEFWSIILPRFAHSLMELDVAPLKQSPWCYSPTASESLRQCTQLRKLAISVAPVDKDWATKKAANITISNIKAPKKPPGYTSRRRCEYSAGGVTYIESESESESEDEYEGTGDELPPVKWGALESIPVLVALDMAELPLLGAVSLVLAEQNNWREYGNQRYPPARTARRTLMRFIPWEGYPHIITGDNSILSFSKRRYHAD